MTRAVLASIVTAVCVALAPSCDLNPQPLPPGARAGGDAAASGGGAAGEADGSASTPASDAGGTSEPPPVAGDAAVSEAGPVNAAADAGATADGGQRARDA